MLVWSEIDEVRQRLAALDLNLLILRTAFERAHAEVLTCSEFAPKVLPGWMMWGRANEFLRQELCKGKPHAQHWGHPDQEGVPLTVHPSGTFQIDVASGGAATGLVDQIPSTRNPKGIATVKLVGDSQLALFALADDLGEPDANEADGARQLWMLLYRKFREGTGDDERVKLRAELSQPEYAEQDERIRAWVERILLPELDLGRPSDAVIDDEGDTPDDPIDVSVALR